MLDKRKKMLSSRRDPMLHKLQNQQRRISGDKHARLPIMMEKSEIYVGA
jgi:hypothetical protein